MGLLMDEREEGGVPLLALSGQLVMGEEVSQYRDRIFQLVGAGRRRLLVDLHEVEKIDSCGIGALVEMMVYTVKQGGQMKLVRLSRRVHNALVVHRLAQAFEIYDTADAALASFDTTAKA
jgi:anti-sigma B factor antagonist